MLSICRCVVAVLLLAPAALVHAQQDARMLELMQQLTRLEEEVRQLRGEVEQLNHGNRRLKNQQNDLYLDLDRRLRALETGTAGQTGVTTLSPSPVAPTAISPGSTAISVSGTQPPAIAPTTGAIPSTTAPAGVAIPPASVPGTPVASVPIDPVKEQASYKSAFNLLKVGKYDEAIISYSEFLRSYPGGKYAANAQYWLGEANYVTRHFPEALAEFQKVISQYPQSKKLPDAMLKIGYIHYELKALPEARQTLTELVSKYPGTTAARLAENRLQRMKLEGR